jgi:hypothetical protein
MDEAERALLAEANAAANGVVLPPPAAPADTDAVMEIEEEPEPENIKIVRDYKRQDPRCDHALCPVLTSFMMSPPFQRPVALPMLGFGASAT